MKRPSPLVISSELSGGRAVFALSGELDLSTVARAEASLLELERDAGDAKVVLDLRELTFMDSSGLRFVVAADVRAGGRGQRLAIVPGPASVHRVFRLASLEERLRFVDAPVDALAPEGDA